MVFFASYAHGGFLNNYISAIQKECSQATPLLIKKGLIALMKNDHSCEDRFLKKLINDCQTLSCEKIQVTFKRAKDEEAGSVIGR